MVEFLKSLSAAIALVGTALFVLSICFNSGFFLATEWRFFALMTVSDFLKSAYSLMLPYIALSMSYLLLLRRNFVLETDQFVEVGTRSGLIKIGLYSLILALVFVFAFFQGSLFLLLLGIAGVVFLASVTAFKRLLLKYFQNFSSYVTVVKILPFSFAVMFGAGYDFGVAAYLHSDLFQIWNPDGEMQVLNVIRIIEAGVLYNDGASGLIGFVPFDQIARLQPVLP